MPTPPSDRSALESLLDALSIIVFRTRSDTPWRMEYISEGVVTLTGHTAAEFRDGSFDLRTIMHPADRVWAVAEFERSWREEGRSGRTVRVILDGGEVRWLRDRSITRRDADGVLRIEGILVDVTAHERTRATLEERERQLADAQRMADLGSWAIDLRRNTSSTTDGLFRILGLPADTPGNVFEHFRNLLAPEDRPRLSEMWAFVERERPESTRNKWHIVRPDGVARIILNTSEWYYDERGLAGGHGTMQDVTARVLAEHRLVESESQQAALLRSIPESTWLKSLDGRYVTVNAAYARRLGVDDPTELIGRHPSDYFPAETVEKFEREDRAVLRSGEVQVFVTPVVIRGEARTFETTIAPYRDASGKLAGTVGVSRDVTERLLMQEQLARAQKMEALGLLSGGVAHDFNNLLSAIIGGVELARPDVPEGSQVAEDLDDVRRAAERGAALTRQLLAFSRSHAVQARPVDVGALVRDAEGLLRRLVPGNVVLDLVAVPQAVVLAEATQLEQIIMNLVVNARDAIRSAQEVRGPRKGANAETRPDVITVETARVRLESGDPRLLRADAAPLPGGDYVALVVRDTGTGIDDAARERIFEPFFTTKRAGEGTGLGLATVANVVSQRGGAITVASTPGQGTTFTIVLPRVDESPELSVTPVSAPARGTETILLVEDEAAVRATARRILMRNGYTVLEARHGVDALRLFREHPEAIDLVVTDLRMPEMGGKRLVETLLLERPLLPVVLMSGYASSEEYPVEWNRRGIIFLAKPISSDSLLSSVREALTARTG